MSSEFLNRYNEAIHFSFTYGKNRSSEARMMTCSPNLTVTLASREPGKGKRWSHLRSATRLSFGHQQYAYTHGRIVTSLRLP